MDCSRGDRPPAYRLDGRYGLIERYLGRLSRLLPDASRDELVAEARRHLFDATERAVATGCGLQQAQRDAIRAFGSATQLALAAWRAQGLPRIGWGALRARLLGQLSKGETSP